MYCSRRTASGSLPGDKFLSLRPSCMRCAALYSSLGPLTVQVPTQGTVIFLFRRVFGFDRSLASKVGSLHYRRHRLHSQRDLRPGRDLDLGDVPRIRWTTRTTVDRRHCWLVTCPSSSEPLTFTHARARSASNIRASDFAINDSTSKVQARM